MQIIVQDYCSNLDKPGVNLRSVINTSKAPLDIESINFDAPIKELVEIIFDRLLTGQESLLQFLEYFQYKLDQNSDNYVDIKSYINKIKRPVISDSYENTNIARSNLDIRTFYDSERSGDTIVKEIRRIDIVNYNLESLRISLIRELKLKKVCVFEITGHDAVLKNYVLKRILNEFKEKTNRGYYPPIEIIHSNYSNSLQHTIERKLKDNRGCDNLLQLVDRQKDLDTVLVIWNHAWEKDNFKNDATNFFEKVKADCNSSLSENRRCLLIILANVDYTNKHCYNNIYGCTALEIPKKFLLYEEDEGAGILEWFENELDRCGLENNEIEKYIRCLKEYAGDIYLTFQEIQSIIKQIAGV
ncbi:hypothetical protein [Hyella patelloides]|uniref:hypothetical protein n=1 Tax=Hyella patelloides TaxID=1982969 RepID=UPI00119FFC39|nr:hypothetical protein [Hyella patelloides]